MHVDTATVSELFDSIALIDALEVAFQEGCKAPRRYRLAVGRPDASCPLVVRTNQVAAQIANSHAAVRPLRDDAVWDHGGNRAARLAGALAGKGVPARPAADLEDEVGQADIVSCCTLSRVPLVLGRWLRPDIHLDLIGGFTSEMCEVDDAAMACATVGVDTETAMAPVGASTEDLSAAVPCFERARRARA